MDASLITLGADAPDAALTLNRVALGVFFAISGLVASVRPLSGLLFFHEVWSISVASSLAAAGASVLAGWLLLAQPRTVAKLIEPYSAA